MKAANLDPEDPAVRAAVFGEQVQDFLRSPVGSYLLQRSEQELAEHLYRLKKASPADAAGIAKLQAQIEVLEGFQNWLAEAVQAGLTAIATIDGEEESA